MENKKVLIIKNEPILLYAIEKKIQKIGCIVKCINNINDVDLNTLNTEFNLLIADFSILTFLQKFKESSQKVSVAIPIIVILSLEQTKHIEQVIECGISDFVVKAPNLNDLVARTQLALLRAQIAHAQSEISAVNNSIAC
jgi:DNA-binding response OmpR family regulator